MPQGCWFVANYAWKTRFTAQQKRKFGSVADCSRQNPVVGGCFGEQAVAVHYRAYNLISVKGSTNKNQGLLFRANQTFYSRQAAKSFCMLLLAEQTSNQIDSVWLGLFAASQQTNAFNDARYHYIIFFHRAVYYACMCGKCKSFNEIVACCVIMILINYGSGDISFQYY